MHHEWDSKSIDFQLNKLENNFTTTCNIRQIQTIQNDWRIRWVSQESGYGPMMRGQL